MKALTAHVWDLLEQQYNQIAKFDKNFIFKKSNYTEFHNFFENSYETFKKRYMSEKVEFLDRHKVAALLIISVLENDIFSYNNRKDTIFIGAELLSVKAAFAYMLHALNEELKEHNKKIEEIKLPKALSCNTSYIAIICRNLYYTKRDYVLNPVELSEKMFLLEQICLLNEGIDPTILKIL